MMRSFALTTLLFLLGVSHTANAQPSEYAATFDAIGKCFDAEGATTADVVDCLTIVTGCFDSSRVEEIKTCVGNANDETGVESCLLPYALCVVDEYKAIVESLPACMNTTITDLGKCYIENANACNSTCSIDDVPQQNPFASTTAASILVCDAFQTDILDVTCDILDCCEPCLIQFEDMMDCIAVDAMDLQATPPDTGVCIIECSDVRRGLMGALEAIENKNHLPVNNNKKKLQRKLAGHTMKKPKAEELYEKCAYSLETASVAASSGTGSTPIADPAELADKLVSGLFQRCISIELLYILMGHATPPAGAPNGSPTPAPNATPTAAPASAAAMSYGVVFVTTLVVLGSFVAF